MADLNPCPFCGGTNTELREVRGPWMGERPTQLICVDVLHWCDKGDDPYVTGFFKLRARDEKQAIERWNLRHG